VSTESTSIIPDGYLSEKGRLVHSVESRVNKRKRWPYALLGLAGVLTVAWGAAIVWLVIYLAKIVIL
jgi:hypothetical protein